MEPAKDRMRNNVSEPPDVEQRGGIFRPGCRLGGPFGDVFIRAKFQAQGQTGVFRPKSRASPRCMTAGRTLERRHCLPGFHEHRVEVTAASALPSDLHRQLDDRGGDLRQCLNALCPEFRFGHGGLSRFGFERCHGSSGACADSMCARRTSPCTVPGGEGLIDGGWARARGRQRGCRPSAAAAPLPCQKLSHRETVWPPRKLRPE
jgi:hypothetical protein